MKTVKKIKVIADDDNHYQILYKLSEPMGYGMDGDSQPYKNYTEYVMVSAAYHIPFSGPETFIFPTDENGEVLDWMELDGSYKGGISHIHALEGAGYEIEE